LKKCTPQNRARAWAGEDGALAQMRGNHLVQGLLPVHALGNRLDDNVAFLQQFQILVVVRRLDVLRAGDLGKRAGLEFLQPVDGFAHVVVRIALFRRQLEQDCLDPGVDQLGGDLRAHDAGAEDGNFTNDESGGDGHVGSLSNAAAWSWPCRNNSKQRRAIARRSIMYQKLIEY
jgi:hypothetical protein